MHLVHTWLTGYPTVKAALDALNAELGTRYTWARLGEWRRGDRPIPPPARDVMLREAVATALADHGPDSAAVYRALRDPTAPSAQADSV